ncbi:hypothetical protein [uncultured phage]|nr:hypothetical protein [uncultured phage]
MDTQQIAEKILEFCKEKYPDLEWNFDFTDNYCKVIRLTSFDDNTEIWLDAQLNHIQFYRIQWQDNLIGGFVIWINPPIEDMSDRYEDTIAFENLAYYRYKLWSAEQWELVSQYRKVMLDIFNFILDEIQE